MTTFSEQFPIVFQALNVGFLQTLKLFFVTLIGAIPLGLIISFGSMSSWAPFGFLRPYVKKNSTPKERLTGWQRFQLWWVVDFKPIRLLTRFVIWIVRGSPLMLQLLVIYFGKYFLFGLPLTTNYRFWAVIIAFSLNYAAYFAEIFRSGIQSSPVGQHEAAKILGYSRMQKFLRIITPQMIKRVLPAVTNESITLVKDTSLAFAISYIELFTETQMIAAAETSMLPYLAAAIFYYAFNLIVAGLMSLLEKKLNYYRI